MWELEKATIVTNNPRVYDKYKDETHVILLKKYEEVLLKVRDLVYDRHVLLTHPQASSLKPNQTPYKSIMVSDLPREQEEFYSQEMTIENSILSCRKFLEIKQTPNWTEEIRKDFMIVDLSLIEGAIQKVL